MSASKSHGDDPAIALGAEAVQLFLDANVHEPDLNGFSLDALEDAAVGDHASHKAAGDATEPADVTTASLDDFSFSAFHVLPEDVAADLFGTNASLSSPAPEDVDYRCTVTRSHKGTSTSPAARPTSATKPSMDTIEEDRVRRLSIGSQGSIDLGGPSSLFDEPVPNEFGLASLKSDNSISASRQPLLNEDERTMRNAAAPPWSELKTKAGKERKRLPLACIACRRKKIRCSGEKPACKHCLRSRVPCVYKVTARKATPRTDYMAMLDRRLRRMEDRIIKIVPKTEQDAVARSSSVVRAVVKPAMLGALPLPGTSDNSAGSAASAGRKAAAKKRQADEAFSVELDHWARSSAKDHLPDSAGPQSILQQQESEENKLLQEGADALPSAELQEHLAEVYFEHVYGQAYHLLHKPSYMRKLKAGVLPPVLILSVCAVSARFSSHPKLGDGPNFLRGEQWAMHARDIVMRRYEWPNITILTCLLLLGLHEFGTCHGGRSWSLGGQAIRMAFALQLHKDVEHEPLPVAISAPLSFTDREIRRRTMWACFLMDRFNSSGTERPTFVREESIKIQLPMAERNFQLDMPGPTENLAGFPVASPLEIAAIMDCDDRATQARANMGVAAYMVRSITVWGRVINYLNQGGKELDPFPMWSPDSEYSRLSIQVDDMLTSLPPQLVFSNENLHIHDTDQMANQFLFLHISIQQSILFLNRFAVSSPDRSTQHDVPKAFVTKAGAKAFAAANRISDLLKESESYIVSAPFVGYCAFLSSTVHIFGIFSGNPTMEATSKRNLATNIKFLSKMKRYWGMFHFMAENLREQYRNCADAARQGTPAHENAAMVSPIFQYGDWFDRYPHGVSNSDFRDPASNSKKEKGSDAVLEQKPELHTVEQFFTSVRTSKTNGSAAGDTANHVSKDQSATGRTATHARRNSLASNKRGNSLSSKDTDHQTLLAELRQQQQRNVQLRGLKQRRSSQTNVSASFLPLTLPLTSSSSFNTTDFQSLSYPQQSQRRNQQQQQLSQFYSTDFLPLSVAQQPDSILTQLDRQLVFGAYGGLEPAVMDVDSHTVLNELGWNDSTGTGQTSAQAKDTVNSASVTTTDGHNHEVSSAWLMPFNMDPPELGEFGGVPSSLDALSSIFGTSLVTPQSSGGGAAAHDK